MNFMLACLLLDSFSPCLWCWVDHYFQFSLGCPSLVTTAELSLSISLGTEIRNVMQTKLKIIIAHNKFLCKVTKFN